MKGYVSHNTYGFKFRGEHQERIAGIHVIGKENRTDYNYKWDGLKRSENDRFVFQYTLGGNGAIRIGTHTYTLSKGEAFFVRLPSDHCYYLPEDSHHWEFIFLTLYGDEARHFYEKIIEKHGHILSMPSHVKPIKHIFRILEKIETTGIHNGYEASNYAYTFLMECMHYLEHVQKSDDEVPVAIAKTLSFIKENYQKDVGLEDIVSVSGLSKYHFTRLFHKTMKETPMQYLTKIRMHHALELLQHRALTIEEVALAVGYSNGNYFSKVFKSLLDISPSQYRNGTSFMPVDRLFLD
ncbi:AraC family transcriptional regulator [Gracilibacillus sp. YIM 98692]|uniref:helix-turn-helix transcriptional regulator n=1 Tax=Gracilibacillus sp. YIM 98692 TaxID=2663532 RepID=UPI0013D54AB2|nr:AraC family transcriptional regulator [Gracilibacillus sp. YIM 98692]